MCSAQQTHLRVGQLDMLMNRRSVLVDVDVQDALGEETRSIVQVRAAAGHNLCTRRPSRSARKIYPTKYGVSAKWPTHDHKEPVRAWAPHRAAGFSDRTWMGSPVLFLDHISAILAPIPYLPRAWRTPYLLLDSTTPSMSGICNSGMGRGIGARIPRDQSRKAVPSMQSTDAVYEAKQHVLLGVSSKQQR